MINLAGKKDCDQTIINELMSANITPVKLEKINHPEVKAIYEGELLGWHFRRNWYYWVAVCKDDPFNNGLEMRYASPMHQLIGKEVRLAGHCGCPSPDDGFWMERYDSDGNKLIDKKEMDKVRENTKESDIFKETFIRLTKEFEEVENAIETAKENGRLVAVSYHIDSQLGLELFCNVLRKQSKDRKSEKEALTKIIEANKRLRKRIAILDYYKSKNENPDRIFSCDRDDCDGSRTIKTTSYEGIEADFKLVCWKCGRDEWGFGHAMDKVIGLYETRERTTECTC